MPESATRRRRRLTRLWNSRAAASGRSRLLLASGGGQSEPEVYYEALPPEPEGGFIMPNSVGFAYEAAAVAAAIAAGRSACWQWSEGDSLTTMAIVERWRELVHATVS